MSGLEQLDRLSVPRRSRRPPEGKWNGSYRHGTRTKEKSRSAHKTALTNVRFWNEAVIGEGASMHVGPQRPDFAVIHNGAHSCGKVWPYGRTGGQGETAGHCKP